MLAGVDYVLMGAGIPREIPAVLDALAHHRLASFRLEAIGLANGAAPMIALDPADYWCAPAPLKRPRFLPIVASNSLAAMLAHKLGQGINGFVIEGPTAGGHNAPPRGAPEFNDRGEPLYGSRDEVDLERIRELGLPFWLAGGTGHPAALQRALASGAAGIQVGTLFAFCGESGLTADLKVSVLASAARAKWTCSPIGPRRPPDTPSRWSNGAAIRQRRRLELGSVTWATCVPRMYNRMVASATAAPASRWTRMSQRVVTSPIPSAGNASAMR